MELISETPRSTTYVKHENALVLQLRLAIWVDDHVLRSGVVEQSLDGVVATATTVSLLLDRAIEAIPAGTASAVLQVRLTESCQQESSFFESRSGC